MAVQQIYLNNIIKCNAIQCNRLEIIMLYYILKFHYFKNKIISLFYLFQRVSHIIFTSSLFQVAQITAPPVQWMVTMLLCVPRVTLPLRRHLQMRA